MAGNQRHDQKASEKKHGTGKVSKISLADALGATHQNTVPMLPAFGPAGHGDSSVPGTSPTVPGNWEGLETVWAEHLRRLAHMRRHNLSKR
jgi:hypothetical protein